MNSKYRAFAYNKDTAPESLVLVHFSRMASWVYLGKPASVVKAENLKTHPLAS